MKKLRILYIYDFRGWAIHNVGMDWARLLYQTHDFHIVQAGEHFQHNPKSYDIILWGYSFMASSRKKSLMSAVQRPFRWAQWSLFSPKNLYAVVHDPCEIFNQIPDWKSTIPRFSHLQKFSKLAVTSNEMAKAFSDNQFKVSKVNTLSHIPLRNENEIVKEDLKIFTRANPHPRKNLTLFYDIINETTDRVKKCEALVGGKLLTEHDYIKGIDRFNCYICTSWQEGGPLPLMDAMRRGCMVLTTRVGQTDEIIEDGVNGFFCESKEDFLQRITELHNDTMLLYKMRQNALKTAAKDKCDLIRMQLEAFLQ